MKTFTFFYPNVHEDICRMLKELPPPHSTAVTFTPPKLGVCDVEITFNLPEVDDATPEEVKKEFRKTFLMLIVMVYMDHPSMVDAPLDAALRDDPRWRMYKDEAREKQVRRFVHEIVVELSLLDGIDHGPCFEAGKCLHT